MEDMLISAGTRLGIKAIKAFTGGSGKASGAGAALGLIASAFDEDGDGDDDFGGGEDDAGGDSGDFGGGDEDTGGFEGDAGQNEYTGDYAGEGYTEGYAGDVYYEESTGTTGLDAGGGEEYYGEDLSNYAAYEEAAYEEAAYEETAYEEAAYEEAAYEEAAYEEAAYEEAAYEEAGTYTDGYGVTYDGNGYVVDEGIGYEYITQDEGGYGETAYPSGQAAASEEEYTYGEQQQQEEYTQSYTQSQGTGAKQRGLGRGLALGGAAVAGAAVLGGVALAAKNRGRGGGALAGRGGVAGRGGHVAGRGGHIAGRGGGIGQSVAGRGRGAIAAGAAGCAPWARGGGGGAPRGRGRPQSFSGQGGVRPPLQHATTAPVGVAHRGRGGGFRGRGAAPRGRGTGGGGGRGRGAPLTHNHSFPVATRGRGATRARGFVRGGHPGGGAGRGVASATSPATYGQAGLPTTLGQPPCIQPQQAVFSPITPQSTGYVANGFQETLGSPPPYTAVVANASVPAPKPVADPAQRDQMSKRKLAALQQIQRREKERIDAKRREEEEDHKKLEAAKNGQKLCEAPAEPKVQINLPQGVKPVQSTVPGTDIKKQDTIVSPQELPPNSSQNGIGRINSVMAPQVSETPRPVSYAQNTNVYPPAPTPAPARVPVPGNIIEMDGGQFTTSTPAPVSYAQSPPAPTPYRNTQNQQAGSNGWSTVRLPNNPVELGNTQFNVPQPPQGPQRTLSMLQRFPSRKPIQQQRPASMMIPPSHTQSRLNDGSGSNPAQNQQGFQYPHQQGRQPTQNPTPQIYPHNAPREPKKEHKEEEEEDGWKPPPLKAIPRRKFNSGEPDSPPQVEKAPENNSSNTSTPSRETSAFVPPPPPPMSFGHIPPLSKENAEQAHPVSTPIENALQTPTTSLSLPTRNTLQTQTSNENVQQSHIPPLPSESVQQAHVPSLPSENAQEAHHLPRPTETTQLSQLTSGAVENANGQHLPPKAFVEHHEVVETPKAETPKGYFENVAPGVDIPGLTVRKGSLPASIPSRPHQENTHYAHAQFQHQNAYHQGTTTNQAGQHHSTVMNQAAHYSTHTNTAIQNPQFSHETSSPTVYKQFNQFPNRFDPQHQNGTQSNSQMSPNRPQMQYTNTFPIMNNPSMNQTQTPYNDDFNSYPRPPAAPQPFNNKTNNTSYPPSNIMEMPASTGFAPQNGWKTPYDMNPMIAELPEIPIAMQGAQRFDEAEYLNRREGISYETKDKAKEEEEKNKQGDDEIKMSANSWGFGWERF